MKFWRTESTSYEKSFEGYHNVPDSNLSFPLSKRTYTHVTVFIKEMVTPGEIPSVFYQT